VLPLLSASDGMRVRMLKLMSMIEFIDYSSWGVIDTIIQVHESYGDEQMPIAEALYAEFRGLA
jgi:hypothetical protein